MELTSDMTTYEFLLAFRPFSRGIPLCRGQRPDFQESNRRVRAYVQLPTERSDERLAQQRRSQMALHNRKSPGSLVRLPKETCWEVTAKQHGCMRG